MKSEQQDLFVSQSTRQTSEMIMDKIAEKYVELRTLDNAKRFDPLILILLELTPWRSEINGSGSKGYFCKMVFCTEMGGYL